MSAESTQQGAGPPQAPSPSVVDAMEEEIVLGLLHPRERLREDDIMARFEVKRHVARSALAELTTLGLVERRPHAGALVREYSAREVRELYEVRDLLETAAAASITTPLPAGALERLRQVQEEHDQAVSDGDLRRVFRTNVRFHDQFFSLSPNRTLVESVTAHARRAHAIRFASFGERASLERARAEHHAMIEALDPLDNDRLRRLCSEHLRPSRDAYLARADSRARILET